MSGVRRALLIGSQTHGLEGVLADVGRMSDSLASRGFTISSCVEGDATRDGILRAYQRLITDAEWNDAVCIYYSGHGGRFENRFAEGPRFLQYLVPTDHGPGSFRGVMSFELSALLARLTDKTPNVTLILDCCHAGQMSRGAPSSVGSGGLRTKAITDDVSPVLIGQLLTFARAQGLALDPESNPFAVRLLATEPHQSAYEEKVDGYVGGVFTKALLSVLDQRGAKWSSSDSLMLQIRELVMRRKADQRPDVEGPRRRVLFELVQVPDERPLALFCEGGEAFLRGGTLFGAVPGARFGVMAEGSEKYLAEDALAEAIVTEGLGVVARVELRQARQQSLPEVGLLAFPLSVPFKKCRVGLGEELSAELGGAIANSRFLAPEPIRPGIALPTVRLRGERLVLCDAAGLRLSSAPESRPEPLLERLECLARAEDLRAFAKGTLDVEVTVEWGRVVDGRCVKIAADESLHVGERQYVSVTNTGNDSLFLAVLGIDPKYSVRLLSRRAPRGHWLLATESLLLGQLPSGAVQGFKVEWPDELSKEAPLRESLLVIATEDEHDFALLSTADAQQFKLTPAMLENSQRVARGIQRGGARASREPGSEYRLWCFDYFVDPKPLQS
jgi:hypothetical protein